MTCQDAVHRTLTYFSSSDKPPIAYGVLALSLPFDVLIERPLPIMVQAVLLPYKDKIIYDGLFTTYNISFGPGIRHSLNESFKEAKERHGIVTSLPMSDQPVAARRTPKDRTPGGKSRLPDKRSLSCRWLSI